MAQQGDFKLMDHLEHRDYPPPNRPWVGHMNWSKLLFAHWPVDPEIMRPLIPAGLTLETWEGKAWIGVVPFYMSGTRPRFSPNIPGFSNFPELNVRTYVTAQGKPGVWFFSLDAMNRLAVWGARAFFYLPYMNATMSITEEADGWISYRSHRTHKGEPAADLVSRYRPTGNVYYSESGSMDRFLTERYCLYSAKGNTIYRADIQHLQWPLQPAEATFEVNTMTQAAGIPLAPVPPLLHYVEFIKVIVWNLERIK